MSDTVIQVENLGKKYIIGHQTQTAPYQTLRDTLARGFRTIITTITSPFTPPKNNPNSEEFWALKDINFEVKQGEVIGIIGRNGAGKSTLLKILSRITEPTTGQIKIKGRIASLLEVGTGFHPELTGRENIYLNGAILGMSKLEINRKFDEIVDFAEVEKFLDTPVKHYSSGMYVRLAFAVAAHLEPEILIVDEVLAVGDANFQKKCLGKMGDVATKEGRTVLFVSHNFQMIRTLCNQAILLHQGTIQLKQDTETVVKTYLHSIRGIGNNLNTNLKDRLNRSSGQVRFIEIGLQNSYNQPQWEFKTGETIKIKCYYQVFSNTVSSLTVYVALKSTITQELLTNFKHLISSEPLPENYKGEIIIELENPPFRTGEYLLYLVLANNDFSKFFDVVDDNINLPYLSIICDNPDPHQQVGYFYTTSKLISPQPEKIYV